MTTCDCALLLPSRRTHAYSMHTMCGGVFTARSRSIDHSRGVCLVLLLLSISTGRRHIILLGHDSARNRLNYGSDAGLAGLAGDSILDLRPGNDGGGRGDLRSSPKTPTASARFETLHEAPAPATAAHAASSDAPTEDDAAAPDGVRAEPLLRSQAKDAWESSPKLPY